MQIEQIILAAFGLGLLSLLLTVIQTIRVNKLNKKYYSFVHGLGNQNVEELMLTYVEELNKVKDEVQGNVAIRIDQLEKNIGSCIQNVGMVNYNAFENVGNEMSFSVAIMDDKKNGFILTGIYARENSYVYAKQIKKGQSVKELSIEEKEALKLAQDKFKTLK